jgi:hypothetical protein
MAKTHGISKRNVETSKRQNVEMMELPSVAASRIQPGGISTF